MKSAIRFKKHSIIRKIIRIFCLILSVALLSSGAFAYFYSRDSMREQILNDHQQSLNHTARQLDYMVNDIKNVAMVVSVEQKVQKYLLSENYENHYENYTNSRDVWNMLNMIGVQMDLIYDFVVFKEGRVLVTNINPPLQLDENYFKQKMQEKWFADMLNSDQSNGFAAVYQVTEHNDKKLLPFFIRVAELTKPSRRIGVILINIDYDLIDKMLTENSDNLNTLVWFDVNNSQVFKRNDLPEDLTGSAVEDLISQAPAGESKTFKTTGGYLIIDRTISVDWKVAAYIPDSLINQSADQIIKFFFVYTLIILLAGAAIISLAIMLMTRPLAKLTQAMEQVSDGNIDLVLPVKSDDEIGELSAGFNKMLADIRQHLDRAIQHEKDKRDFQNSLLIAQINPHFIYNTLHTIIYMAKKIEATDIVNMTLSFITVLHDAVKISDGRLFVSLEQELEVVDKYLVIQEYRYRDRFTIEYDTDQTLADCLVPKTILQPIVENALLHGLLPINRVGHIKIATAAIDGQLQIQIEDDGMGMSQQSIDQIMDTDQNWPEGEAHAGSAMRSIGLNNVQQRIRYLCGENYGLAIESEQGSFTRVQIKLPINRANLDKI